MDICITGYNIIFNWEEAKAGHRLSEYQRDLRCQCTQLHALQHCRYISNWEIPEEYFANVMYNIWLMK